MVLLFLLAANVAVWSSGNAPAAVAGEPVDMTITIRQQGFGEDPTTTPTHQLWEKNLKAYMRQFGTEMEIEWDIPGDFYNTYTTYMAAGDYADVMVVFGNALDLGKAGKILNLADYNDYIPNYNKWMDATPDNYCRELVTTADGEIFEFGEGMLSEYTGHKGVGLWRFDIFEKHNIPYPKTMQDITQVARQLKKLYPNSYPVGEKWQSLQYRVLGMNRTQWNLYWNGEEYVYGPIQDESEFRGAMAWMNELYTEGLLDPEWYVHSTEQAYENCLNGTYFIFLNGYTDDITAALQNELYPDMRWGAIPIPKGLDGKDGYILSTPIGKSMTNWESLVVNSKVDYPRQVIQAIDYMYTEESMETLRWGIEGVTYIKNADGTKVRTPEMLKLRGPDVELFANKYGLGNANRAGIVTNPMDLTSNHGTNHALIPVWRDGKYFEDYPMPYMHDNHYPEGFDPSHSAPPINLTLDERDLINNTMGPINTYIQQSMVAFILGEMSIKDDYDDFVAQVNKLGDWQSIVDLQNKKAIEFFATR